MFPADDQLVQGRVSCKESSRCFDRVSRATIVVNVTLKNGQHMLDTVTFKPAANFRG
ncbi:hypothetical protein Pla52nx_001290 [Stieleria varia]|nr:hypothetical protein [Stieleria varia]